MDKLKGIKSPKILKDWSTDEVEQLKKLSGPGPGGRKKVKEIARIMNKKIESVYRQIYNLDINIKQIKTPSKDEMKYITAVCDAEFRKTGTISAKLLKEIKAKTGLSQQNIISYIKTLSFIPATWPKAGRPPNEPKHNTIRLLLKEGFNLRSISYLTDEDSKYISEIAKRVEGHYKDHFKNKNIKSKKTQANIKQMIKIEGKIIKCYKDIMKEKNKHKKYNKDL